MARRRKYFPAMSRFFTITNICLRFYAACYLTLQYCRNWFRIISRARFNLFTGRTFDIPGFAGQLCCIETFLRKTLNGSVPWQRLVVTGAVCAKWLDSTLDLTAVIGDSSIMAQSPLRLNPPANTNSTIFMKKVFCLESLILLLLVLLRVVNISVFMPWQF